MINRFLKSLETCIKFFLTSGATMILLYIFVINPGSYWQIFAFIGDFWIVFSHVAIEQAEGAGMVMTFSMVLGLALGALSSLAIVKYI